MASGDTKTEALMDILENGGNIDGIAGCCNTNLQNYIIDSINSVSEAKASVTAKGGTVGNTGLAGLATEIAGIPSGGGSAVPKYARVKYYPYIDLGATGAEVGISRSGTAQYGVDSIFPDDGITVTIDGQKLDDSLSSPVGGSEFLDDIGRIMIYFMADGTSDLMALISVEDHDGNIMVEDYQTVDVLGYTYGVQISSVITKDVVNTLELEYPLLPDYVWSNPGYYSWGICREAVKEWIVGTDVTDLPDSFLVGFTNLDTVDLSNATLSSIGYDFCAGSPNLLSVNVGANSASVATPGDSGTLSSPQTTDASYINGIEISGSASSSWITAYPDSATAPYRHLVDGSLRS